MKIKCNANFVGYAICDLYCAECFHVASELFPNRMMASILGKIGFQTCNEKYRKMIKRFMHILNFLDAMKTNYMHIDHLFSLIMRAKCLWKNGDFQLVKRLFQS